MAKQGSTIKKGSKGESVIRLQRILVMMGTTEFDHKGIDGDFGPKTENAVKTFQTNNPPLKVDGIVGPKTWAALPNDPETCLLAEGDQGLTVKALQTGLKACGVPNTDPGNVDGDFGPKTKKAVKEYQKATGLDQDGVVGNHTWFVIGPSGKSLAKLAGLTTPPY